MEELNQFCERVEGHLLAPKQPMLTKEWNDPSMQVRDLGDTELDMALPSLRFVASITAEVQVIDASTTQAPSHLFEDFPFVVTHLNTECRPDPPARSVLGVGAALGIKAPLSHNQTRDVLRLKLHSTNTNEGLRQKAAPEGRLLEHSTVCLPWKSVTSTRNRIDSLERR
jgi:hypothetical protein